MFAQVLVCGAAIISVVSGGLSVQCAPPTPTPTPIATALPTPVPTQVPTPTPTTAAQAAQACAGTITNGLPLPSCVGTAFFPGSGVYRRLLSVTVVADPNSTAMIHAYFGTNKGGSTDVVSGLIWHNGASQAPYSYGRPLYRATISDPLVSVRCTTYCAMGGAQVRIPSAARPEGGSDGHLAVIEPDATLFDSWSYSGGPVPSAGSVALSTVTGLQSTPFDVQPAFMKNAVTAGGMVTPAGIITLAELQAGVIQHELYGVISCTASTWYAPATQTARVCTDGRSAIPDGALLQYIPTASQIAASSMSPESKIIALAMHNYGIRIADTGGVSGLAIQVENQASFWAYGSGPDPYVAYAMAHGWNHVVNSSASPPLDRYIHPLTDLALPDNLRVLASGN